MKTVTLTLTLLFALGLSASPAFAAEDASPLIDNYITATGGTAAIESIRSQVTKGTFSLPDMGMYAPFEMYIQPPDKSYMSINFAEVSPAQSGVSGEVAWQVNPMTGPQVLSGEDRVAALRGAQIEPMLNWKQQYAKAEIAGEETIGGQACTKVVLTPPEGSELVVYFDNATHLIARLIGIQGGMRTQTDFSDYRNVGGLKQPHKMRMVSSQYTFEITVDSIEHNVAIPPEKFALPSSIQTLVGR